VGTISHEEAKIYVDGRLAASHKIEGTLNDSTDFPVFVGNGFPYYPTAGIIGEVKIFSKVLNKKEIKEHYLATKNFYGEVHRITKEETGHSAIKGMVFCDKDKNGKRDSDEKGIPNILVSNGIDVVSTNGSGHFTIKDMGDDTIYFITRPSGYLPTTSWYWDKGKEEENMEFGFFPTEKDEKEFSFVNIGDTHLAPGILENNKTKWFFQVAVPKMQEEKASFIIHIGDIAFDNLGNMKIEEKEKCISAFKKHMENSFDVPVWYVYGNHEDSGTETSGKKLFKILAPPWYSFNWGNFHCVVIKNTGYQIEENQFTWIKNDLALQPANKPIIVFTHEQILEKLPDNKKLWEILSGYNTVAVFNGHHHQLMLKKHGKTLCMEYGAICGDYLWTTYGNTLQPVGYGYTECKGDKIVEARFKSLESNDPIAVLVPRDGHVIKNLGALIYEPWDGRIRAVFLDYLHGGKLEKMEYRIAVGKWRPMQKNNSLKWLETYLSTTSEEHIPNLWVSEEKMTDLPEFRTLQEGLHKLSFKALIAGEKWEKEINFYTSNKAVPTPNLISNSSFETPDKSGKYPEEWSIDRKELVTWDEKTSYSGTHSMQITYPDKPSYFAFFRSAPFKIDPSKKYNVSVRVKGENIPPKTQFVLTTGGSFIAKIPTGTYDWIELNGQFFFPPNVEQIRMGVYCQTVSRSDLEEGKKTKIWLDDLEVKQLEDFSSPWVFTEHKNLQTERLKKLSQRQQIPINAITFPAEWAKKGRFSILGQEMGHMLFYFYGEKSQINAPQLQIEIPAFLKLLNAYNIVGGHSCSYTEKQIEREGKEYTCYTITLNDDIMKKHLPEKVMGGMGGSTTLALLIQNHIETEADKTFLYYSLLNAGVSGEEKKISVEMFPPISKPLLKRIKFYLYDSWLLNCPDVDHRNNLLDLYEKLNMSGSLSGRFLRKGWETYREPAGGSFGAWGGGYWGIRNSSELSDNPQDILITLRNGKKTSNPSAICQTFLIEQGKPGGIYWEKIKKLFENAYFEELTGFIHNYELNWKSETAHENSCFCPRCIKSFSSFSGIAFSKLEHLSPDEILARYKKDWYDFRFWQNAKMQEIFYKLAKSIDPYLRVILCSAYLTEKDRDYPLDIRECDEFVDEHWPQFYWDGTFLYKVTEITRKQLKKPIVALLCTACPPEEKYSLSFSQVKMATVVAAAAGCEGIGYFIGSAGLDGEWMKAINEAQNIIVKFEDYFLDGQRLDASVKLEGNFNPEKVFYKFYNLKDSYLLALFNYEFKDSSLNVCLSLPDNLYSISLPVPGTVISKNNDLKKPLAISVKPWDTYFMIISPNRLSGTQ
jgi:predicted phosphodiesterase